MMNWKGFEGSGHGLIEVVSDHCLAGLRKTKRASARIMNIMTKI
jgi:hypothetical protein